MIQWLLAHLRPWKPEYGPRRVQGWGVKLTFPWPDPQPISKLMSTLATIAGVTVTQDSRKRVEFTAGAQIDADGANGQSVIEGIAKWAYKLDNTGLEDLRNGGYPNGGWRNIFPTNGSKPVILPGGYMPSMTTYAWAGRTDNDPNKWVDSYGVPYIVVPPQVRRSAKGVVIGCKAIATNLKNGRTVECVVADIGPTNKIGELSIAAARALGINSNPRTGGTSEKIIKYELFPGKAAKINGEKYNLIPA